MDMLEPAPPCAFGTTPGTRKRQIGKIAPAQRECPDLGLHDHVAFDAAVFRVQRRDVGGNVDRFRHRSHRQLHIVSQVLPDFEHDAFLVNCVEALFLAVSSYAPGGRLVMVNEPPRS